jgi:hypothetical protein
MNKRIINALFFIGIFLLFGCPIVNQKLVNTINYRKDLKFKINDHLFIGVGIPPLSDSYKIEIEAPFELDLIRIETCHREISIQDAFYKKRIIKKRKKYHFTFKPLDIERDCIIEISALSKKEAHAFGMIVLNNKEYGLTSKSICNGVVKTHKGVSLCQAKNDLIQVIQFFKNVEVKGDCPIMEMGDNKFKYEVKPNHCVFLFMQRDLGKRKIHKLHVFGYQKIILRKI